MLGSPFIVSVFCGGCLRERGGDRGMGRGEGVFVWEVYNGGFWGGELERVLGREVLQFEGIEI